MRWDGMMAGPGCGIRERSQHAPGAQRGGLEDVVVGRGGWRAAGRHGLALGGVVGSLCVCVVGRMIW